LLAGELASIGLSLGAALSWGGGDYIGGTTARKTDAMGMVVFVLFTGSVMSAVFGLASREPMPAARDVAWAMGAGLFGGLALAAFYHSLAIGKIGINAPIAGVLTAAIPAATGMAMEGAPRPAQIAGFVLAALSIALVSQSSDTQDKNKGAGLALLAGVGFGLFLVFLKLGTATHVYWPLAASRFTSASFVLLVCLALQRPQWFPRRGTLPAIVSTGILDTGGSVLFAYAAQQGRMDVAAVVASLYPAVPVVLARVLLKEYLTRVQLVGVAAALLAIVLIAR